MKKIVLSLGGSLIVPQEIQVDFLKQFRELIVSKIDKFQFVIFAGGGKTCRVYQDAAAKIVPLTDWQLDWIGIHASRLNAQLLHTIFEEEAEKHVVKDPTKKIQMTKPILIGAGWKPGWSTDFVAVQFAVTHGFTQVVNLSNIEYVYDKDPKKFPDAKPFKEMTWAQMRELVGDEWTPGMSAPFDPIASKLAQEKGIEVIVANGTAIDNIRAILEDQDFVGTRIK